MKICETCKTREAMPIPEKDMPSTPHKMLGSPSGTTTFFFPTSEGKRCYYCEGRAVGRITGPGDTHKDIKEKN